MTQTDAGSQFEPPVPDPREEPATSAPRGKIPDPREEPTISVPRAGKLLGLSRMSSYDAANRGEIPTLRFGRRMVVPTAVLLAMLGLADGDAAA